MCAHCVSYALGGLWEGQGRECVAGGKNNRLVLSYLIPTALLIPRLGSGGGVENGVFAAVGG